MVKCGFHALSEHNLLCGKTFISPSSRIIDKSLTDFHYASRGTTNAERVGCPKVLTTLEMVGKIHGTVFVDCRIKVREVCAIR